MAAGWSVMDAINRNSKAAAEDRPKARFRTRDISVKKMYSNVSDLLSIQFHSLKCQTMLLHVLQGLFQLLRFFKLIFDVLRSV